MLCGSEKDKTIARLKRIEGQVRGILRMVEDDRYCMDILAQTRAVSSAISKVEEGIMENHLRTCVASAFERGSEDEREAKISEVMSVVSGLRRYG